MKTHCRKMVGFLFSGSPMHITTAAHFSPPPPTQKENTRQIDTLRDAANEGHIAEHIRGMVAATMSNLTIQASDATQNEEQQWRQWALGVADGLELPVAG